MYNIQANFGGAITIVLIAFVSLSNVVGAVATMIQYNQMYTGVSAFPPTSGTDNWILPNTLKDEIVLISMWAFKSSSSTPYLSTTFNNRTGSPITFTASALGKNVQKTAATCPFENADVVGGSNETLQLQWLSSTLYQPVVYFQKVSNPRLFLDGSVKSFYTCTDRETASMILFFDTPANYDNTHALLINVTTNITKVDQTNIGTFYVSTQCNPNLWGSITGTATFPNGSYVAYPMAKRFSTSATLRMTTNVLPSTRYYIHFFGGLQCPTNNGQSINLTAGAYIETFVCQEGISCITSSTTAAPSSSPSQSTTQTVVTSSATQQQPSSSFIFPSSLQLSGLMVASNQAATTHLVSDFIPTFYLFLILFFCLFLHFV